MTEPKPESTRKNAESTLSTIAAVAKACGVSKSTAVRRLKELNLPTVTDLSDGRGRQLLPPETASALAASLAPSTAAAVPDDADALKDLVAAQTESYRRQIASLERENERLADQIEKRDAASAEVIAQTEQRIDELKRENERLRDELALSKRLEGFHWPWTRDRIKAQHLLPTSTD